METKTFCQPREPCKLLTVPSKLWRNFHRNTETFIQGGLYSGYSQRRTIEMLLHELGVLVLVLRRFRDTSIDPLDMEQFFNIDALDTDRVLKDVVGRRGRGGGERETEKERVNEGERERDRAS